MENLESDRDGLTVYELGFLVLPSIPEDKVSEVLDRIRKTVTEEGGVEIGAEAPFIYPLAYPISKTIGASRYVLTDAYLGWIKFEVERSKVKAIQAGVEKIEEIPRFLLIKAPRETVFTFAAARQAIEVMEEKEKEKDSEPSPAVEAVVE
ncbi:MAG: 30S ribosomal protein S6 [bacterium]|nr:30S ribosomal protein S6 [bacterium]